MENISVYGYTDIGGREENEDTGDIRMYKKNIVAVIADGLGGQGDGKAASSLAVRALRRCGSQGHALHEQEVAQAFRRANEALLKEQTNAFHMKTTAVYLCIHDRQAIWAHVGDSRLYHFHNDRLCHYTLDHSFSQMAVALGEIRREDIPEHPQRNRLLRALGCEGEEAEVHEPVFLENGRHGFLLCTDGFWEWVNDREIAESLHKSAKAEEWIQKMRIMHQSRCGKDSDNHTAAAMILEV